jgi:uncharacterized protein YkwD
MKKVLLKRMLTLALVVTGMAAGMGLAGTALWQTVSGGGVSSAPVASPPQPAQETSDTAPPQPTSPPASETTPAESSTSGSLAPTASSVAPTRPVATVEQDVLARLNSERESDNLPLLVVDAELNRHAAVWAKQMAETGYAHSPSSRLSEIITQTGSGAIGENIHAPEPQCAAVQCVVPSHVPTSGVLHVDWMGSSVHRNTMLERRWDRVGAGIFCDANGRMWAVMLFASPSGVPVRPPASTAPRTPHVAGNDGVTCKGTYRGPDPGWVHPQPS